jgi:hypothetical protein
VSLLRATEKLRRDGATFTAALHNVADVQALTIPLTNVNGSGSNVGPVLMNVLGGDTNEDRRTNVNDINQTKSRSGMTSLWMGDSTSTTLTSSNLIREAAFPKSAQRERRLYRVVRLDFPDRAGSISQHGFFLRGRVVMASGIPH